MEDDINVTNNSLYLFIPKLIPSVENHLMFKETAQNIYKVSFDEWYTERRVISDMIFQLDIGSAQQVNSPKYLLCAQQTKDRTNAPINKINFVIFDNLDLRKYHVEIDNLRYPRDSLLKNYEQIDYIEQYKNLYLFFHEYIGEPILNPHISYPDMKTNYPIEILDLRHQHDHITPKKINYFTKMALILTMLNFFK